MRRSVLGHGQYYYLALKPLEGKTGLFITPATSRYIEETLNLAGEEVVELSHLEQRFAGVAIGNYRVYKVRLRLDVPVHRDKGIKLPSGSAQ